MEAEGQKDSLKKMHSLNIRVKQGALKCQMNQTIISELLKLKGISEDHLV